MIARCRLFIRRRRRFGVGRCRVVEAEVYTAGEAACQYQPVDCVVSVPPHLLAYIPTPSIGPDTKPGEQPTVEIEQVQETFAFTRVVERK